MVCGGWAWFAVVYDGLFMKAKSNEGYTRAEQIKILHRYNALREEGWGHAEACAEVGVGKTLMSRIKTMEDEIMAPPGPWMKTHRGKTWRDMPGNDGVMRRCIFALFRRGLYEPGEIKFRGQQRGRKVKALKTARAKAKEEGEEVEVSDADLKAEMEVGW